VVVVRADLPNRERRPDEVVVVDNDFDVAEALQAVLASEGYRTAIFTSGRDALHYVRERVWPGLVLLDARIRDVEASAFLQELGRIPPANIPALLMSVDSEIGTPHEVGVRGVLHKPFDRHGLLNVVSSILS
jgi:DNA-binding NtrC family response regulator